MYDDEDLKKKAVWLAKEALQGFFGTDKTGFRDMKSGGRAVAISRIHKALQKLFQEKDPK
jgi:hypothetical protein